MNKENVHHGHNIRRFREMREMKQDALAQALGGDWTQRRVSMLEQKNEIEPAILLEVAKALDIPVEAIQNMEENSAINIICNTFHCTEFKDNASVVNVRPVFDAADKILKLHEEKIELYERMLREKEEMMGRLELLIKGK